MIDCIIGIIAPAIVIGLVYIANIFVGFINNKESKNIQIEIDQVVKNIQDQSDYDVFKLLYKNVRESTEYYIISKRQANKSFTLAIISCFLGVIIYMCGFLIVAILDKDITLFTTISGTVVELIAGLSFWVYNKCVKQLDEYHKRLSTTEKYLTSIQMADKMSESQKDNMYRWIITTVMLYDLKGNISNVENKDNNQ